MEIQGTIKVIGNTQTFGNNGFEKRELVILTEEQYPQTLALEFVQGKVVELDKFAEGEKVKVGVNLRGREWVNPQGETKYFNTIQGWKIERVGGAATQTTAAPATQHAPEVEEDDLPF